jgi:serpin B
MQNYYDAKAEALDFSSPQTLDHINGWCNEKTNGMIPTILDEVDPGMISYLLNAIYFKADWASKFDQKNTKEETFTTEKGKTKLPLMHQNVLIQYINNGIFSAVKIPYGNGMWNMMVMLPEEGKTTDDIINHLAACGLAGVEGAFCEEKDGIATMKEVRFYPHEVDLKLPCFETSSDTNDLDTKEPDKKEGLIGIMQKMGINLAFDSNFAEIPNMCEQLVYIDMMRQKAKIKVNEEGSEAAAVTVVGVAELTMINEPEYPKATFHANRPFVYVISEASSGVILFVGKFTGQ